MRGIHCLIIFRLPLYTTNSFNPRVPKCGSDRNPWTVFAIIFFCQELTEMDSVIPRHTLLCNMLQVGGATICVGNDFHKLKQNQHFNIWVSERDNINIPMALFMSGFSNTLFWILPSVTGKVNSRWRPSNWKYNVDICRSVSGQTPQWCHFRYWPT